MNRQTLTGTVTAIALALAVAVTPTLEACTGLKVTAKDGSAVHGRTLEFGIQVALTTIVVPRGYQFTGTTPQGKGLPYTTKYGFVGAMAFTTPAAMDGMNEKGLSVGTFYFPGFAGYSTITAENQAKALSPVEFPNWILSQFATLEEVKAALPNVVIAPTVVKEWGPTAAPFHYIVYDKQGNAIVIEPIAGKLVVSENRLGTFTNSPTFDWHMTNLRNYINMRTVSVPPIKIDGVELASFGMGSGMVGLPGDFTPPSRFVRAATYSTTALPVDNSEQAVMQTFHLLNQFDIPLGSAREVVDGVTYADNTMITCVRNPDTLKYYFKTYEDQNIKMIDLKKFDLDAKAIKKAVIIGSQGVADVSAELK